MLSTRSMSRAAALLVTTLVGGLGVTAAPALAGPNDHTVSVRIISNALFGGWKARLSCVRPDGTTYAAGPVSAPVPFPDYYTATFAHVPDGTCSAQATSSFLGAAGGTGSVAGVAATDGAILSITPSALVFACQTAGTVSGASTVGSTLTAAPATFTGGLADPATRTHTWYRSGQAQPVQSSTQPTYIVTPADIGHQVSVVAAGSLLGLADLGTITGGTGAATCATVAGPVVIGMPTATPATPVKPGVTGKPIVGHVVTADPDPAPAGTRITGYQWYVHRAVHGHERTVRVRIKHAHHRSLRMKERLAGKHVLVGVTYTFADGTHVTVYSKPLKVMKERMKE